MSEVKLVLSERVKKDYKKLTPIVQKKFKKQLRFLATNPRLKAMLARRDGD